MSVQRLSSACYYNIISRVTQRGKRTQKIGEKQKNDSQLHYKSLTSGVEKACREKRGLRSEAQLSLRSMSSVGWPRYTKRERRDRCWLKGKLLFFWGDVSCCIKPQMSERNGGKTAEWAYGGMTQGASKLLAYPDISPLDGEIHVFPSLGTFLVLGQDKLTDCPILQEYSTLLRSIRQSFVL